MRYFGYGSNLHAGDLARWLRENGFAPGAIREVGPAWLPDHEPVYHYESVARRGGALSVRERVGRATPGVLFDVDEAGWRALDRKEGAKYARAERCVLHHGREVRAITYMVTEAHQQPELVRPQPEYAELVRAGLAARGLPTAQAEAASRGLDIEAFPSALFVYGTLMRGLERAHLLERHGPRRWASAQARGELVDLGDYPGLIDGAERIEGELVILDEPGDAFAELDEVEDFRGYGRAGSLYRRDVIMVAGEPAWTYRYVGPPGPRVASGDWRRR